ncbi:putative sodium-coupled neutral amino acid transporter 10 isoform X2 [Homalodisca vitripennis]|nr:putative sodium-coupled neutral amino acid transporter 10 isoform X2 [Homalodisca vitripennis]XP_046659599.1 putative sodium-coupled neutral amino acid transporter 10 isoform X2 [Homalodisca vitripennis]KAG8274062.1 hypothetical protein J6590_008191 [Homalodisca vitripennis]
MGTNTGHVMTLANSIIGVSVLAMPFCYKQCGIVLASIMLVVSSIMSRLACYYLIKAATLARRRNFEFLAFHTFGPTGKLTVELSIIGFMLGTCVAFFVVMGDLGPAILGPLLDVGNPSSIRASVLIAIAMLVVLPLGLLRNVDSLAAISAITIAFYICLVLKVMGEATTHLLAWDWMDKVHLWRPAGLLQCIPIFSMALSCQTQLFEIFDSIPNASLDKMTVIVGSAVNLCTLMYMAMGFFGYVAFCTQPFSGNLMLSFSPTPTSEVIKMGFVLSIAVSFPLVIFPCRASLHSLLFRRGIPPHQELLSVTNHMTEGRFKCLTFAIVAVSLVTGILIPNIELVLGLVGSTIGVLICIMMPATLFLCLTTRQNNERLLAQVLWVGGLLIMVLGSYANLYATEEAISGNLAPPPPLLQATKVKNVELVPLVTVPPAPPQVADVRREPPVPEAPVVKVVSDTPAVVQEMKRGDSLNLVELPAKGNQPAIEPIAKENAPVIIESIVKGNPPVVIDKSIKGNLPNVMDPSLKENPPVLVNPPGERNPSVLVVQPAKENQPVLVNPSVKENQPVLMNSSAKRGSMVLENQESKKEGVINSDAIKKEDDEIKEVQKQEILKKKEELIEKLEENEQKQQKLLEEQKKILEDIKLEKEKLVEENKQLKEVDKELPVKIVKSENLKVQNEVVVEENKKDAVFKKVEDDEKIPKIENNLNSNLDPVRVIAASNMDIVKKNMADGVPLPIAVKHIAPRVEGVKAVKVVDDNDGGVDSKILRREILAEDEVREKRDLTVEERTKTEEVSDMRKAAKETRNTVHNNDDVQKTDEGVEQCGDKDKPSEKKLPDDSKPQEEKVEIATDSIIKSPLYLSDPKLVLPGEKLQPGRAMDAEIAKPMKRDLKSLDTTQQKMTKDSVT